MSSGSLFLTYSIQCNIRYSVHLVSPEGGWCWRAGQRLVLAQESTPLPPSFSSQSDRILIHAMSIFFQFMYTIPLSSYFLKNVVRLKNVARVHFLTENILYLHYKDQIINAVRGNWWLCCLRITRYIKTRYEEIAEKFSCYTKCYW
jgi:hypothetical protein